MLAQTNITFYIIVVRVYKPNTEGPYSFFRDSCRSYFGQLIGFNCYKIRDLNFGYYFGQMNSKKKVNLLLFTIVCLKLLLLLVTHCQYKEGFALWNTLKRIFKELPKILLLLLRTLLLLL